MKSVNIAIVYYPELNKKYFDKSLLSALSQTETDFEITIYLDSVNRLPVESEKITQVVVPAGLSGNPPKIREYIVKNTTSKFLAFWDSDDIYTPSRLQEQLSIINQKNLDICFADFGFFNEKEFFTDSFFNMIGFHQREVNIFDENYMGFGICTGKTSFFKQLLPFPEIKTLDWWVAIRCKLMNASVGYVNQVLGYYRIYNDSLSTVYSTITKQNFINERINKIELYKHLAKKYPEFDVRKTYFEKMDVEKEFNNLHQKYSNRKFKNIWGGLIQYEEN